MSENFGNVGDRFIDFLVELPAMNDRATRDLLLKNLPNGPTSVVTRHEAMRQDVTCIVESVIRFDKIANQELFAFEILIENTRVFVSGLDKENQLNLLLNDFQDECQAKISLHNHSDIQVPFVIVSMTFDEAKQLKEMLNKGSGNELNIFRDLTESLKLHSVIEFTEYYGQDREDWKPYTCSEKTIKEVIIEIVCELNKYHELQESNLPVIKPCFLSTDCFELDFSKRANAWHKLRQTGCIVIVDSVSLFHPEVRDKLSSAEISSNENVSILTLSPVNPWMGTVNKILENLVVSKMEAAFLRFNEHLDKRCEMGVGDLRSIRRWFFSVLPETVEILKRQKAQPENRRSLRKTMGNPIGVSSLWRGNS